MKAVIKFTGVIVVDLGDKHPNDVSSLKSEALRRAKETLDRLDHVRVEKDPAVTSLEM